jgi:hypothetical protein
MFEGSLSNGNELKSSKRTHRKKEKKEKKKKMKIKLCTTLCVRTKTPDRYYYTNCCCATTNREFLRLLCVWRYYTRILKEKKTFLFFESYMSIK